MQVRVVKMHNKGLEHDRRALRDLLGHGCMLIIIDVADEGLRRPAKVAWLMQGNDDAMSLLMFISYGVARGGLRWPDLSGTATTRVSRWTTYSLGCVL